MARVRTRYAAVVMCLGGLLLLLGPTMPWLVSSGARPRTLNAFHLGRYVTADVAWMHLAGVVYLLLGALVAAAAMVLFMSPRPRTAVIVATALALTVCGALDTAFTKSAIHGEVASHAVQPFSVGYGYTLCSIGGPMALVATCWLWYTLRRDRTLAAR